MHSHPKRQSGIIGSIVMLIVAVLLEHAAMAQEQPPPPTATQPSATTQPQQGRRGGGRGNAPVVPTLGLEDGYLEFDTPEFSIKLVKASQTIASLAPKGAANFDFTPADQLPARCGDRFNHLGDLTLRIREGDAGAWRDIATSAARKPVTPLPVSGAALAAADLSPTLPPDCPLQITRSWLLDHGKLVLRFDITNKSAAPVQIGALGIPVVFNNMIQNLVTNRPRPLPEAHETCCFFDPYIGLDAGYLQVTRLSGAGPALVVVPDGNTPFEAYRLLQEPVRPGQTFEGAFEWMVRTQAYAENEWKNAQPWNPPTMTTLVPGQAVSYGLKFLVADQIRDIEKTLAENNRPVAVGIPGYILPMDLNAKLFLNYPHKIASIQSDPPDAVTAEEGQPTKGGWKTYTVRGKAWGRARLTVTYDDTTKQTISYYVIKPSAQVVADLGNFSFTKQWFVDPSDPFHRSPSVMTYNRAADKIVTQDGRVWIAGLGDEGGSGSWLAAAMKLFGQPRREEIEKFEQFVDGVLWGGIQYKYGPLKYGVRKSLFYYDAAALPDFKYDPSINWGSWTSWNKRDSERIDRAYNYPHVVAAYWSMYRLARNNQGVVTNHPWDWYLNQAYETVKFLSSTNENGRPRVGYIDTGLMEGDIFVMLLKDLKLEGWNDKAAEIETAMKGRADRWKSRAYPFGSEMAWDSTGQEEVYAWTSYFGYDDKALVSLNSILGYMPTLPHWGYNGNARRYWDFIYGAAPGGRIERQLHHYGSGINAIPVLAQYRQHPDDYYLLRVGYGGEMGALSNIDQEGFSSAAFHSFPQNLKWDPYSGDYGPNFFGHAVNTATYVINHPEFGWQAFGGNVRTDGDLIKVQPLDSFRRRVYLAPLGLWLTLDAGQFEGVEVNPKAGIVRLNLAAKTQFTPNARLRVEQPAKVAGVGTYRPFADLPRERDAYTIWLEDHPTQLELTDGKK